MIPFKTTPEQISNLPSIKNEMVAAGVDVGLVDGVFELAQTDQGVYDLMAMWGAAKDDPAEREAIEGDLQQALKDYAVPENVGTNYVRTAIRNYMRTTPRPTIELYGVYRSKQKELKG